jgi:hypothetical protein
MLEPGNTAPLIKGGTPVRAYECGGYRAILARDPESFGPIKYPHVLIVFRAVDDTPPIMFITAEQSTISSALMKIAAKELGEDFGEDVGHGVFLGVFDESGHSNLGSSNDYAVLDKFETEAIAVMRRRLELHASVRVTRDFSKENRGFWRRLWGG